MLILIHCGLCVFTGSRRRYLFYILQIQGWCVQEWEAGGVWDSPAPASGPTPVFALWSDYRIQLEVWEAQLAKDPVPLREQQRGLLFTV